jgi:hypothetical protein
MPRIHCAVVPPFLPYVSNNACPSVLPLAIVIRAETSWRMMQPSVANVIAHKRSSWNCEPAATAVVTVPGPMKAAEMMDHRTTLESLDGIFKLNLFWRQRLK